MDLTRIGTATVPLHAKMLRDFVVCPLKFVSSFGSFEAAVHIEKTTEELQVGASIVIDFAKPKNANRAKKPRGDPNVKRTRKRR